VVKSKLVPPHIREALHIESGLNDGLVVPLLVLFIALSGIEIGNPGQSWLAFIAQQIGYGILVGLGIGWLGGLLMIQARRRAWMTAEIEQLAMLCLAILSGLLAEKVVHGNGFIQPVLNCAPVR
jgi:NhaP-type Na+/H+ or K+/H+ antiporter